MLNRIHIVPTAFKNIRTSLRRTESATEQNML